jgi:multiple sugar transport system permease protein
MAAQAAVPAPKLKMRRNDLGVALLFLAPALVGLTVFYLWPALRGVYLSFTEYNLLRPAEWIGFDNYIQMAHDPVFWNSLKVTLEYVFLNILFQTTLALLLAVLMQRFTRSVVIRGIVLLPYVIANVVVALVWYWMMDYNLGIVNEMLDAIGLPRVPFFGSDSWAMPTIAFVNVWRHLGYTALLIFAGLQTIPRDVYEAAEVDGAGEWRTFRSITLPLLRPVLAFVLVITVTGSFQIFDTIAVTTSGGPINATRAINFYIYEKAFGQFDFGYASAMSVVLLIILAVVAIAQMKFLRADSSDMER